MLEGTEGIYHLIQIYSIALCSALNASEQRAAWVNKLQI